MCMTATSRREYFLYSEKLLFTLLQSFTRSVSTRIMAAVKKANWTPHNPHYFTTLIVTQSKTLNALYHL